VEIMVGLAIGMLATLVIMQVFTVFEAQKRVTTGTADAQTNGSIALYTIGRDLKQAGYPLMPFGQPGFPDSAIECTTLTLDGTANYPITYLAPVVITDGASDTIAVHYGDSPGGGIPSQIGAMTGNIATVGSNVGCQAGDKTLIVNGAGCAMSIASAVSASSSSVPPTVELQDTNLAVANANLACLGRWNEVTYAVSSDGNLLRDGAPVIAGIVNIQAQYGVSATKDSNQVVSWEDPSGVTWGAPTVDDRNRIKAVRVAIVARTAKREGLAVTDACSSQIAAAPTGLCAWEGTATSPAPAINLSDDADGTSWRNYRYRVFETIIPLRNVLWSRPTL
jgi:type IV pilus assembly protein PilW